MSIVLYSVPKMRRIEQDLPDYQIIQAEASPIPSLENEPSLTPA
jgi:hypothetical protein